MAILSISAKLSWEIFIWIGKGRFFCITIQFYVLSKKDQIKELISAGNIKEVLEIFKKIFSKPENKPIKDNVISLLARYCTNELNKSNRLITTDEWQTEKNTIVWGTIEIINSLGDETIDSLPEKLIDELFNEIIKTTNKKKSNKLKWSLVIFIGIIGLIVLVYLTISDSSKKAVYENPKISISMSKMIPAGDYPIGTRSSDYDSLALEFGCSQTVFSDDLPFGKYRVDSFKISKFEISVSQYRKFLEASPGYPAPQNWSQQWQQGQGANFPVTLVSHDDAAAFCNWLSEETGEKYRLPTDIEWEVAARGTDERTFPWGDMPLSDRVICLSCGRPVKVNGFSLNQSPFGAQNMSGNVAEWTSSNCETGAVIKGGSWGVTGGNPAPFRCAHRQCKAPDKPEKTIGFRILQEIN